MERYSQVLHYENTNVWFFIFKKVQNWILTCDEEMKINTLDSSISVLHNM